MTNSAVPFRSALENKAAFEPVPLVQTFSARTKAIFGASPLMQEIQSLIGHVGVV